MRYRAVMGMHGPSLAALFGLMFLAMAPAATAQPVPHPGPDERGPAMRSAGGAISHATVTATIIRQAARVGHGLGPPAPQMVARARTVSAADGRAVQALVYDFE